MIEICVLTTYILGIAIRDLQRSSLSIAFLAPSFLTRISCLPFNLKEFFTLFAFDINKKTKEAERLAIPSPSLLCCRLYLLIFFQSWVFRCRRYSSSI